MENYSDTMQKVLTAIEGDLEYITIEDLIAVSGYSYYHFHRIFKAYTGETLNKYIKRIQLERALFQMQVDKENITKIAMKSGYNTPSAFNKAFKEMFGINPSEYKKSLEPKRKTYTDIEPIRLETIESISVYTIRHVGDYKLVDVVWDRLITFASKHKLFFSKNFYAYAITHDNPDIANNINLRYDACISRTKEVPCEETICTKELDGGKYAIFLHKGEYDSLTNTYNSIFGNWLHKYEIVLRDVPVIQKFLNNKFETPLEELLTEVYVPIV
jgi:AraC family transcriptional regulator